MVAISANLEYGNVSAPTASSSVIVRKSLPDLAGGGAVKG
jgi:hypothetical protein